MDKKSTSMVTVREAVEGDCDMILEMIKEMITYHEIDLATVQTTTEDVKEWLFGERKLCYGIVAEDSQEDGTNTAIGYALFSIVQHLPYGKMVLLSDLYVKEVHRAKGIGSRLMKEVAKMSASDGCNAMLWLVWQGSANTVQFYRNKGAVSLFSKPDWVPFALEESAFKDLAV